MVHGYGPTLTVKRETTFLNIWFLSKGPVPIKWIQYSSNTSNTHTKQPATNRIWILTQTTHIYQDVDHKIYHLALGKLSERKIHIQLLLQLK